MYNIKFFYFAPMMFLLFSRLTIREIISIVCVLYEKHIKVGLLLSYIMLKFDGDLVEQIEQLNAWSARENFSSQEKHCFVIYNLRTHVFYIIDKTDHDFRDFTLTDTVRRFPKAFKVGHFIDGKFSFKV